MFPRNQYKGGWAQAVRFDDPSLPNTEWKAVRSNRDAIALFNLTVCWLMNENKCVNVYEWGVSYLFYVFTFF
eukprot:m.72597 g.72597  ORF g.72597 m.72597 type:complete len:72 (-) comp11745_c0_seq3:663-878(-)